MATPSEILRKTKKPVDNEHDEKKSDNERDEKVSAKSGKRNALIDFIAKHKKTSKE